MRDLDEDGDMESKRITRKDEERPIKKVRYAGTERTQKETIWMLKKIKDRQRGRCAHVRANTWTEMR